MKTIKTTFIVLLSMIAVAACKKDEKTEPVKKVEPIVSDWISPDSYIKISGRPTMYDHNDSRITEDIISKGRIVAYVRVRDKNKTLSQFSYHLLKSTLFDSDKYVDYQIAEGTFIVLANFDPKNYDPKLSFSYRYVLMPEGFDVPPMAVIRNYEAFAATLGFKK